MENLYYVKLLYMKKAMFRLNGLTFWRKWHKIDLIYSYWLDF